MQIFRDLYQVSGDLNGITVDVEGEPWNDCNSYIVKTNENKLVMFDCGCGNTMNQIFENIKYWGMSEKDITHCCVTHAHLDHAGGAYKLRDIGVKIVAHTEVAQAIKAGDERCCGYLYHKKFHPSQTDIIVKDKEQISLSGLNLSIGHYPGHTAGCTAYFFNHEKKKFVVSGDIIGTLLAGYFGWDGSIDFDKKFYIQSLQKFAKIDVDVMLPGHGLIYFNNPKRRIEDALNQALIEWR